MSKLLREHDDMINAALKKASDLGVYLVLRVNKNERISLDWKDGGVESVSIGDKTGVGLYTFTESGHVGFGSSNLISEANIVALVESTAAIAKANELTGTDSAKEIYGLAKQENLGEDGLHYNTVEVASIDQSDLQKYCKKIEDIILANGKDVRPIISTSYEQVQWRILRSDGTDVDFALPYARARISMTLRKDDVSTRGFVALFKPSLQALLDDLGTPSELIAREVAMMRDQLKVGPVQDPGTNKPVLIAGDLAGTLVHEALGHPAESDAVAENASVLGDENSQFTKGALVAAIGVTVVDHEEGLNHGFHPYGTFGNKREPVTIIDDGILKESLSDIFTAAKSGVANKNTERSEDYSMVAIPRMSTTYIKLSPELLIETDLASTEPQAVQAALKKHGIFKKYPTIHYLIGFRGGSVSPKTGTFMFGSGYTYELSEKGAKAVKPASFSGDVLGALKSIEFGAGKLTTDDIGYCGKSSQRAYVSDGGHELIFFAPTKHVGIA